MLVGLTAHLVYGRGESRLGGTFGDSLKNAGQNSAVFPSAEKSPHAHPCPGSWHGNSYFCTERYLLARSCTRQHSALPRQQHGAPRPTLAPHRIRWDRSRVSTRGVSAYRTAVGESPQGTCMGLRPPRTAPTFAKCSGSGGDGSCGCGVAAGDCSSAASAPCTHYVCSHKGPFSSLPATSASFRGVQPHPAPLSTD